MKPPGIKGQREKEFIQLKRREQKLWQAQRNLGYERLEKPVHRGWDVYLVLRDDVARRKDANVLQEIVNKCGLVIWNRKRKLLSQTWERHLGQYQEYTQPGIRKISQKSWFGLSPEARKWFTGYHTGYCWNGQPRMKYRCKVPHHFFQVKVRKSWFYFRKRLDWELERELAEVEARIANPVFRGLEYQDLSRWKRNWYHWSKNREENIRLDRKKTKQELKSMLKDHAVFEEIQVYEIDLRDYQHKHLSSRKGPEC